MPGSQPQALQGPLDRAQAPGAALGRPDPQAVQLLHHAALGHALPLERGQGAPQALHTLVGLLLAGGVDPVQIGVAQLLALGLHPGKAVLGPLADQGPLHLGGHGEGVDQDVRGHVPFTTGHHVLLDDVDLHLLGGQVAHDVVDLPHGPGQPGDLGHHQHVPALELVHQLDDPALADVLPAADLHLQPLGHLQPLPCGVGRDLHTLILQVLPVCGHPQVGVDLTHAGHLLRADSISRRSFV